MEYCRFVIMCVFIIIGVLDIRVSLQSGRAVFVSSPLLWDILRPHEVWSWEDLMRNMSA